MGPGVLSIPYSMLQMGIPATVFFYIVLAVINVWCSHLLIDVNDYTHRNVLVSLLLNVAFSLPLQAYWK